MIHTKRFSSINTSNPKGNGECLKQIGFNKSSQSGYLKSCFRRFRCSYNVFTLRWNAACWLLNMAIIYCHLLLQECTQNETKDNLVSEANGQNDITKKPESGCFWLIQTTQTSGRQGIFLTPLSKVSSRNVFFKFFSQFHAPKALAFLVV